MAPLNTGHLVWWLRQRLDEEDPTPQVAAARLTVDQAALELWSLSGEVRTRAIAKLLDLADRYQLHPGYKPEWRRPTSAD